MSIEKKDGELQPAEIEVLKPDALVDGCELSELEAEQVAGGLDADDTNKGCGNNLYKCATKPASA